MSENFSTISTTKHMNVHTNFFMEFIEDNFIKIIFAKLAENTSNILTKNVRSETYEAHVNDYVTIQMFWETSKNAMVSSSEGVKD